MSDHVIAPWNMVWIYALIISRFEKMPASTIGSAANFTSQNANATNPSGPITIGRITLQELHSKTVPPVVIPNKKPVALATNRKLPSQSKRASFLRMFCPSPTGTWLRKKNVATTAAPMMGRLI